MVVAERSLMQALAVHPTMILTEWIANVSYFALQYVQVKSEKGGIESVSKNIETVFKRHIPG